MEFTADSLPMWMYNVQGQGVLCATAEEVLALEAEGYQSSLLALGIETHPSNPPQQVAVVGAGMPEHPPVPGTDPSPAFMARLDAWTNAMEHRLTGIEGTYQLLHERLEALEAAVTGPSPSAEPAEAPGTPRRRT